VAQRQSLRWLPFCCLDRNGLCSGFPWWNSAIERSAYGSGTIFKRGEIWYVSLWADGRQIQKSSGSRKRQNAVRLRDQLLGKKARGEMGDEEVVLQFVAGDCHLKAAGLTTEKLKTYRRKRLTSPTVLPYLSTSLNWTLTTFSKAISEVNCLARVPNA